MFKSVFAKYITAFMSIILLSFVVIIAIIASIIGAYSENAKAERMENVAHTAGAYLEARLAAGDWNDLGDYISLYKEEDDFLSVIASADEDLTLLLADNSGEVLMAVGNGSESVSPSASLPKKLMDEVNHGASLFQRDKMEGVFDEPHHLYAIPVYNEHNFVAGTVFVCATTMMVTELLQVIVKTIIIASLWVLIAALIAVYFISEKVISPLKDISRAAKSFAAGKFDVRVPVRGRDEVSELAVAFNNMAESLNNYDLMRNTFMSNVSHDLRSPMTSIAGFIDGILDGVIPPDKHQYYLSLVSEEVKRLSRLVASLLDLSRIQAGERKFTMAPFDVCEVGRQILISFEQKINDRHLEVEFDIDEEDMEAVGDRDAIYQILYNLCDNAVKFSAEGGLLRLSVKRKKNKKILVSVYNEGQGISEADLPYVFERFYKSDKSRGLNKSGVGLGLFIAKTIIDSHGEEIWVESEFGANCCFNFTLPAD